MLGPACSGISRIRRALRDEVTRTPPATARAAIWRSAPATAPAAARKSPVPGGRSRAFQDIGRHRYFNTNSIWLRLDVLKDLLAQGGGVLPLPMIRNRKTVDPRDKNSTPVIQLEVAMGAAIECFEGSQAIEVPRSRFAPVKSTADLFALRSDAYHIGDDGRVESGGAQGRPRCQLDDSYKRWTPSHRRGSSRECS